MKTKGIFFTTIIICAYSFCNAQPINTPAQWLAFQQRELKECPYIFEGSILRQECYYGNSGVMTCSVMQITKIYRSSSQVKLGTIKVLTMQGGQVGDGPRVQLSDGGPGLGKGHYIIFGSYLAFGRTSDSITVNSIVTDNLLTLHANDWATLTDAGASWGWRKVTKYPTVDSLYSFFKANGVTIQEQVPQADSTKH